MFRATRVKVQNVGETTVIEANVKNGSGTTTFNSNNKAVAAVDKNGNVKGIGAGKAIITVKNNNVKATIKVTVIKKINTFVISAKKLNVKYKTKKVFKNAIIVDNAKGDITYTKLKGKNKISVNKKTGEITVNKGLKKGNYKLVIKVT